MDLQIEAALDEMVDGVLASIGHNNPPEATPYEAIRVHIADLYEEAKGFLDGEPITTQGQHDAVENLLDMIRKAEKAADAARREENKPFDDAKAEVQERYNALIGNTKAVTGLTVLAAETCKAALKPWREARAAEAAEAARLAREDAQRKADEAAAAMRAAEPANLAARQDAEAMVKGADKAAKVANKAEKGATTGLGLRTVWAPVMTDGKAAATHYWQTNRAACEAFFLSLAKSDVLAGKRQIPGFDVVAEKVAI